MKRIVLTLLFGFIASQGFAQISGTVNINVTDSGTVAPGVAVFFYDSQSQLIQPNPTSFTLTPENYVQWAYTDANGDVSFNFSNMGANDTLFWGAFNCNGTFQWGATTANFVQGVQNLWLTCLPGACDVLTRTSPSAANNTILAEAVILRDSTYLSSIPGRPVFEWTFNGTTTQYGTSTVYTPNQAGPFGYCFSTYVGCTPRCDSAVAAGGGGNPITCQASYFVDTVNSRQFQSQIILGENSTTSSGSIISWSWDFGDGTVVNGQYPSHTYASATGVYNICLTVVAVDGTDTCASVFCDSIGFDSNGNLVFKNGFTVNVVDPATFSVHELQASDFSLYPNPAKGKTSLSWENGQNINSVDVYTMSGQKAASYQAIGMQRVEIANLKSGAYIVKVNAKTGSTSLKLIIE